MLQLRYMHLICIFEYLFIFFAIKSNVYGAFQPKNNA